MNRLEVVLFQSEDSKRCAAKRVLKRFIRSPFGMNGNAQDDLPLLKSTKNGEESKCVT